MAQILLFGYGRMGRLVESVALSRGHRILASFGEAESDLALPQGTDVAIDFSVPAVAEFNCRRALDAGIPVVSGTTGWNPETLKKSVSETKGAAFLHATNMSVGVNVAFAVNRVLAKALISLGYRAAITETHHIHKLDAPSGTAITLAEGVLAEAKHLDGWQLQSGASPGHDRLPIEAIRSGEVIGHHVVRYTSGVDTVMLTHEAFARDGFALGAVLAAEYVVGRRGLCSMAEVLGLDVLASGV